MNLEITLFKQIIECALLAAGEPMPLERFQQLFSEEDKPTLQEIREALDLIQTDCESRGLVLTEIASGYTLQIRTELQPWISKLWEKRPPRYSRALLETLALVAYRQPITRAEIEDIRGVSVSSQIFKTLMEREWVRIVGHKDVPGKPALYATTKPFLDYFNLKSLDALPSLPELAAVLNIADTLQTETPQIALENAEENHTTIEEEAIA